MIYLLAHHWIDKRKVPDAYLDELFTQDSPNGAYVRSLTKENFPWLWADFKQQLARKNFEIKDK